MSTPLLKIAYNEFYRVINNPLVVVVGAILLLLTYIYAAGSYKDLQAITALRGIDGFFRGFSNLWYVTNFICAIMAAYLGVNTIAEDRYSGTSSVLNAKPLYRRDIVLGKFLGINGFIILFLALVMVANSLLLTHFYGVPASLEEYFPRIITYTLILSAELAFVVGFTMLIGTFFKDILLSTSVVITFLSFEWFWDYIPGSIYAKTHIPITPHLLVGEIFGGIGPYRGYDLMDTSTSLVNGLTVAAPEILLLALLVVGVVLINCFVYTKPEEA